MSAAFLRQNDTPPSNSDNTIRIDENIDPPMNDNISTTMELTKNIFSPSTTATNVNDCMITQFLTSPSVELLFRDSIMIWKRLQHTRQQAEESIIKMKADARDKRIPSALKINVTISLPHDAELKETVEAIEKYKHECNVTLVEMILKAREHHVTILTNKIKTHLDSCVTIFNKYVDDHIRSASDSITNFHSSFPKQKIIEQYKTNLTNQTIMLTSEMIQKKQQAKLKKQMEQEERDRAEELVKTNKPKSVEKLIEDGLDKRVPNAVEKALNMSSKKRMYGEQMTATQQHERQNNYNNNNNTMTTGQSNHRWMHNMKKQKYHDHDSNRLHHQHVPHYRPYVHHYQSNQQRSYNPYHQPHRDHYVRNESTSTSSQVQSDSPSQSISYNSSRDSSRDHHNQSSNAHAHQSNTSLQKNYQGENKQQQSYQKPYEVQRKQLTVTKRNPNSLTVSRAPASHSNYGGNVRAASSVNDRNY